MIILCLCILGVILTVLLALAIYYATKQPDLKYSLAQKAAEKELLEYSRAALIAQKDEQGKRVKALHNYKNSREINL